MDDPSTFYTPLRMSRPWAPGVVGGGIALVASSAAVSTVQGASISQAFPVALSVGNLIVCSLVGTDPDSAAYTNGMMTNTGGGTVGGIRIDNGAASHQYQTGNYRHHAIYSGVVTVAGTPTMTFSADGVGSRAYILAVAAFSGNWASQIKEASNYAANVTDDFNDTSFTSGGATSAGAALFIKSASFTDDNGGGDWATCVFGGTGTALHSRTIDFYTIQYLDTFYRIGAVGATEDTPYSLTGVSNLYDWQSSVVVYKEG